MSFVIPYIYPENYLLAMLMNMFKTLIMQILLTHPSNAIRCHPKKCQMPNTNQKRYTEPYPK